MTDRTDFSRLFSNYYPAPQEDGSQEQASKQFQRRQAVSAALSILEAHAAGGTESITVTHYKGEIGPLADAIQKALEVD